MRKQRDHFLSQHRGRHAWPLFVLVEWPALPSFLPLCFCWGGGRGRGSVTPNGTGVSLKLFLQSFPVPNPIQPPQAEQSVQHLYRGLLTQTLHLSARETVSTQKSELGVVQG